MGLDNFWVGGEEATFEPPLNLCGGMLSSTGSGSFRGKVYADIVEAITGISLYADKINNTDVAKMASALATHEPTETELQSYQYPITTEEYADLVRMFILYGNMGASLASWW